MVFRFLCSLLIFGATLEAAARIDDWARYGANPLRYYGSKNLRWVDDSGLPYNRPGVRFEKWFHDERGFRVTTVAPPRHAAAHVVCLGTSESYGLFESPAHEWPAALASRIAADRVAVSNASVVGMSPFQYGRYFDQHVAPAEPDLVVLVISPFSVVQGTTAGGTAPPDTLTATEIGRMRAACRPTPKEQSRLLPRARTAFMDRLPEAWSQALAHRRQQQRSARARAGAAEPGNRLDAPPGASLAAYADLMDALAQRLRSRGVEVAFCTYPNSLRLDGSASAAAGMAGRQRWLPSYSPEGLIAISRQFAAATRAQCAARGYRLIDLEAVLPKDDAHFADSVHLTDLGADLVAREVQAACAGFLAADPARKESTATTAVLHSR